MYFAQDAPAAQDAWGVACMAAAVMSVLQALCGICLKEQFAAYIYLIL